MIVPSFALANKQDVYGSYMSKRTQAGFNTLLADMRAKRQALESLPSTEQQYQQPNDSTQTGNDLELNAEVATGDDKHGEIDDEVCSGNEQNHIDVLVSAKVHEDPRIQSVSEDEAHSDTEDVLSNKDGSSTTSSDRVVSNSRLGVTNSNSTSTNTGAHEKYWEMHWAFVHRNNQRTYNAAIQKRHAPLPESRKVAIQKYLQKKNNSNPSKVLNENLETLQLSSTPRSDETQ